MAVENDDQLVERLVPKILASIRSKAKAVESIDIKADLTGITSIPCYDTSGGIFKQVLVDVNALKEPAFSAGETALDAANKANEAANNAKEAASAANEFADKVVVLTEDEYDTLLEQGDIDDSKIYYTYEPEEQEG